jgi:hypothetical protein
MQIEWGNIFATTLIVSGILAVLVLGFSVKWSKFRKKASFPPGRGYQQ